MKRLVNDNVIRLFPTEKYSVGTAVDDKEFFKLLADKVRGNLDKMLGETDKTKKSNALVDMLSDLSVFGDALNISESFAFARREQLGGYKKRYVVEDKHTPFSTQIDVEKWAIEHEYPEIKGIVGPGEESWKNAFAWSTLNEPYKQNYRDLITAISKYGKKA